MARFLITNLFFLMVFLSYVYTQKTVIYDIQSPQSNGDYYKKCAVSVLCDTKSKYRTFNGSCNNLKNVLWGSSKTPHIRLSDAVYSGGERELRKQSNGTPLPGPRELQLDLLTELSTNLYDNYYNVHLMQWGQFLAHDIHFMPPDASGPPDCCTVQNQTNIPYQCRTVIKLSKNDPVFGKRGRTCLPFRRALTSSNFNCTQLPNSFLVQTSHYIDASHVYSSDKNVAESLRTMKNGQLRSELLPNGQQFCPQRKRDSSFCNGRDNVNSCFEAGDFRVNQNFGIASYHVIFLRLHNILASYFQKLNSHWSDEIVYQEARKVIGAIIQIITYKDFIPSILGKQFSEQMGLSIYKNKTVYNEKLMSSTGLEFGVGAFRSLHAIIPTEFKFANNNHTYITAINITDWMNKPDSILYNSNIDHLMIGMSDFASRRIQPSYNNLISNYMNHYDRSGSSDMSLISSDIQRGRDVGLPPYTVIRKHCGLPDVKTFENLNDVIALNMLAKLKKLYASVHDIDLIVGILLENPAKDSMLGPTARCIIADGFYRYRYGDRFFFDVEGQPGSFTLEQIEILQNINIGHILCLTTNIKEVSTQFFRLSSEKNSIERLQCKDVRKMMKFVAWKTNSSID
ncbi:peroxidase-like [Daktulosphaira vitifoliae]|uniref:peroxidase-like n=1 Tax=Daktulosphaira vitifoliae TaxID=58002 RepID=UPI0021AA8943|nr:peroxidase-like [Daktulosphaira vitifoliae]XP_050540463.1 peroxidase-like [Daktulosphaira vitifoliae]XP_050540465.1 peroxidase-like [Daktulosphaira vitifoliae]XP_050540466.1 peroxidase-like [Daktulosphaira vitifoliae]XP_050540467.1 peroxidase-like [Daktulosphaira vitifoliae]